LGINQRGYAMPDPVLWSLDPRGVARVTLNRPEVNNAYNGAMIEGLHQAMDALAHEPSLRAVVITGNGRHFQAGADLNWLNTVRTGSPEENEHASRRTAEAVDRLNRLPVPTIALVQGFCVGGAA
jgi:methylglutaconyl-CoA hydratase